MKDVLIRLFAASLGAGLVFFVGAFTAWSIDPAPWNGPGRFFVAIGCVCAAFVGFFLQEIIDEDLW